MPLPMTPPPESSPPQKPSVPKEAASELPSLDKIKARAEERKRPTAPPKPQERRPHPASRPMDNTPPQREGWKTDPKTGKSYKVIPKSEYDSEGNPILHLDDLNLDDLNGEANKYLAHLRVPPDRDEMEKLRAEKMARAKASTAAYNRANASDDES